MLRVFGNRVLRKAFGAKRDGVTREWRRLQDEELYDLYSSPNIRPIKSQLRWAGHVARTGEKMHTGFWWGERRKSVDGRIILRWIFRKWDVGVWTGSSWLRIGTVGGHL